MENIPYLSRDALAGLGITAPEMVAAIEATIRDAARGTVWAAPKAMVTPNDGRYMMAALAARDDPSLLAVKTVVMNPGNTARGLPQINGLVTMLDSATGRPAAILDGNWITALRTAGLSAAAARYLARPDAESIGFVGTGVQARSHLRVFAELFPLHHVRMFGRGRPNRDRLAQAARDLGLSVEDCATGQKVVERADILVTTVTHTGGAEPFLDASGMKPGAFAAVVDLGAPWHRDSFAALTRVFIDDLAQEATIPAKLCDPGIVAGDLSGLVTGDVPGRMDAGERTAFVFRGHALGDLALSVLALQRYRAEARDRTRLG